ncbi:hypothetical protein Pmani_017996 [Petrolisthes manimaculis]|uniref:Uncharacterized protein n=1 Tax=Petrolisthes manimaculis TaxID=1843537 RepID=A0AAE1PNN3_9EUCA|nr:hypothetical protein Pmani_017996 [Petrolisthes manimaculis]
MTPIHNTSPIRHTTRDTNTQTRPDTNTQTHHNNTPQLQHTTSPHPQHITTSSQHTTTSTHQHQHTTPHQTQTHFPTIHHTSPQYTTLTHQHTTTPIHFTSCRKREDHRYPVCHEIPDSIFQHVKESRNVQATNQLYTTDQLYCMGSSAPSVSPPPPPPTRPHANPWKSVCIPLVARETTLESAGYHLTLV